MAARRALVEHVRDRVDDGLVLSPCMSRALESGLALRLLQLQAFAPAERRRVTGFLQLVKHTADPGGPDLLLVGWALGEVEAQAGAAAARVAGFRHFTAGRKQLLAQAVVKIFGGRPAEVDIAYDRTGLHSWARATMAACAVILHPEHATDRQVAELRATQSGPGIWDRYVLCHLLVLHALRLLPGHEAMVHAGVDKLLAVQRADGGFPLIVGDPVFSTAHIGMALAALPDPPRPVVRRLADRVAALQQPDGGWAYDVDVAQTEVDSTSVAIEFLRAAGRRRYTGHLTCGRGYLERIRGRDGGWPTYLRGAASEDAMTAAAANALDPHDPRTAPLLAGAIDFLAERQRPDDTFEPGWHRSQVHTMCRVVLAMRPAPRLTDPRHQAMAERITRRCVDYLHRTRNPDGGWGQLPGEASDPVSTALALIVLSNAAPADDTIGGGMAHLLTRQDNDGGYTARPGMYGPRGIVYDVPMHACMYPLLAFAHLENIPATQATPPSAQHRPYPSIHHTPGSSLLASSVLGLRSPDSDRRATVPAAVPDLYMPFPVRLNPHWEAAERHALQWAAAMEMTRTGANDSGEFAWDEGDLGTGGIGKLTAYYFPEAAVDVLALLTGWMTLSFYGDDHFSSDQAVADPSGFQDIVDRLPAFMPDPPGITPLPTCPEERALTDLWARTATRRSSAWRRRIATHVQNTFRAWLYETSRLGQGWVSDPVDYFHSRRSTIAQFWFCDLLEHANDAELPPSLHLTEPVRRLHEATVDTQAMINDLFSYAKETERDQELTNLALSVQDHLGADVHQATDQLARMVKARIRTFEHLTTTELPDLADAHHLDTHQRRTLRRHGEGLQDHLAALAEWSRNHTDRYQGPGTQPPGTQPPDTPTPFQQHPTGLGTSAATLPPFQRTHAGGRVPPPSTAG